jgi:hypothetical protein
MVPAACCQAGGGGLHKVAAEGASQPPDSKQRPTGSRRQTRLSAWMGGNNQGVETGCGSQWQGGQGLLHGSSRWCQVVGTGALAATGVHHPLIMPHCVGHTALSVCASLLCLFCSPHVHRRLASVPATSHCADAGVQDMVGVDGLCPLTWFYCTDILIPPTPPPPPAGACCGK